MTKTVLVVFQDRADVERAIDKFKSEGFKPTDFSIVMKDKEEAKDLGNGTGANVAGGAATGAVVGGIAGALMGMGLSREDAEYYEGKVNEGAILLAVPTRENQEELVMTIFDDSSASDVRTISQETSEDTRPMRHTTTQQDNRAYAHADMGAKGGTVADTGRKSSHGKGWHKDSKEHAVAATGNKTRTKAK